MSVFMSDDGVDLDGLKDPFKSIILRFFVLGNMPEEVWGWEAELSHSEWAH